MDKVQLCQVPPDNPSNAHGICIRADAVPAHLANGSYLGACNSSGAITLNQKGRNELEAERGASGLRVETMSNPAQAHFTLITKSNTNQPLQIKVFNALGAVVEVKSNATINTSVQFGQNYRPCMYYAEVVYGKQKVTVKLIKGS